MSGKEDLRRLLLRVPHFGDLSPQLQEQLIHAAHLRRYEAGQVIYLTGEPAEAVYMLAQGWVKATRISCRGREQALRFLHAGELFGDVAVFSGVPYPATVTALESVAAWALPASEILRLSQQSAALTMVIARHMAERVLYYVDLIEDLSLCNVEARVARTLLRYAEPQGEHWLIPRQPWTTFDEMAVRLGTVRDVLSRALRRLENEGLLKVERNGILILDLDGLARRGEV